jgi:hypothetical protein
MRGLTGVHPKIESIAPFTPKSTGQAGIWLEKHP